MPRHAHKNISLNLEGSNQVVGATWQVALALLSMNKMMRDGVPTQHS